MDEPRVLVLAHVGEPDVFGMGLRGEPAFPLDGACGREVAGEQPALPGDLHQETEPLQAPEDLLPGAWIPGGRVAESLAREVDPRVEAAVAEVAIGRLVRARCPPPVAEDSLGGLEAGLDPLLVALRLLGEGERGHRRVLPSLYAFGRPVRLEEAAALNG